MEALIVKQAGTVDPVERRELIRQITNIYAGESYRLPNISDVSIVAEHPWVNKAEKDLVTGDSQQDQEKPLKLRELVSQMDRRSILNLVAVNAASTFSSRTFGVNRNSLLQSGVRRVIVSITRFRGRRDWPWE